LHASTLYQFQTILPYFHPEIKLNPYTILQIASSVLARRYTHPCQGDDVQFCHSANVGMCLESKLGLGCQQHCSNCSSMMYGLDLGFICYIHELRKKSGSREFLEYIYLCSLFAMFKQIHSSIVIFLLDKSNLVNDVRQWKWWFCLCLNPVFFNSI
jgi:hypothetical protein